MLRIQAPSSPQRPRAMAAAGARPAAGPVARPDALVLSRPQGSSLAAAPLTTEEASLVRESLLDPDYARLKGAMAAGGVDAAKRLFREGKKGPFSPDYGDPTKMLDAARSLASNPVCLDLRRMRYELRTGDVLLVAYNGGHTMADRAIASLTGGPFAHALVCVKGAPAPEFVEATNVVFDPRDDKSQIRRTSFAEVAEIGSSYRVIRPTEGMPPEQARKAAAAAATFAEAQLGKPYRFDYGFGSTPKGAAFYCSELAFQAYREGAGVAMPVDKSAKRDAGVARIDQMTTAAGFDRAQVDALIRGMVALGDKGLDLDGIVNFLVDEAAPHAAAARGLTDTPAHRTAAKAVFHELLTSPLPMQAVDDALDYGKVLEDKATPAAAKAPLLKKDAEDFTKSLAGIDAILRRDLPDPESRDAVRALVAAVLPALGPLVNAALEENPEVVEASRQVGVGTAALRPGLPPELAALVPASPPPTGQAKADLVSPNDLGAAKGPHRDYNVRPDLPLPR